MNLQLCMLLIWDMSHWVIELSWLIVIYLSQWFWIHCIYDCISLFFNQPTQVIKQQRFYFCDSCEQWSQNNTIISLEKSVNFKLLFSNSVCVLCQWKTKSPFCFGTFYILRRMFDTLTTLSILNTSEQSCMFSTGGDHYQCEFRWEPLSCKNYWKWWKIISSWKNNCCYSFFYATHRYTVGTSNK